MCGANYRLAQRLIFFAAACAILLFAADQPWRTKPAAEWTESDARQVLTASPWVRTIMSGVARRLTEDALREGGQMGQPQGVGNEGVDPKGSGPKVDLNPFTGRGGEDRSARSLPSAVPLKVVWASALPIRLAELKSHTVEPPTLEGDGYQIAVYGVPGIDFKQDPLKLGEPLKQTAALRREGQKDVKPTRVEVFQRADGLAVVYLFPLSAELSKRDGQVEFEAHIGRITVAHTFLLNEMEFQGRLEL